LAVIRKWRFSAASALLPFLLCSAPLQICAQKNEADEKAGAVLFRDKGCTFCHGVGGAGTAKAPSLLNLRNNKEWTPAKITQQITNGGAKMPPFGDALTDQEIAQLVAYLRAKHRPEPPPAPAAAPTPAPQQ
jgi:mono/diheme cytochrome c family protein